MFYLRFIFCLLAVSFSFFLSAENIPTGNEEESADEEPVKVEVFQEYKTIQASNPFWIAIQFNIEPDWHIYWKNPGDAGRPVSLNWELPPGFKVLSVEWPTPQKFSSKDNIGFGYENEAILLAHIQPSEHLEEGKEVIINLNPKWVACSKEECRCGNIDKELKLLTSSQPPVVNESHISLFEKARSKLPQSIWSFQAERKEGLLELRIHTPYEASIENAAFYSEEKNSVDYKKEPIFTASNDPSTPHLLILREEHTMDLLKGILILKEQGKEERSININIPIFDKTDDETSIGIADPLPISNEIAEKEPSKEENISNMPSSEFEGGLGLAIVLAFVGGMILNLMPCVLPVVSFKILSFVKLSGQSRSLTLKHGLIFSLGVLISFWVLAGVLLLLQAYGRSVGWGFQLQEPLFVAFLAALLLIFGLSLFGLFEMGMSVTSWAGQAQGKIQKPSSLTSSFMSGVLATAVATPCSGPFLGTAIGFAVTLPSYLAMLVFTSLGMGMAFPYLLLAAFPSLLRFMPKPGNWMITFKEIMGFFMVATVLWLIWVFGAQTNATAIFFLLTGLFFLTIGGWIYGKWGSPIHSFRSRFISYILIFFCFCLGGYSIINSTAAEVIGSEDAKFHQTKDEWEVFSPERVKELQSQGIPVFIDFTAKWCLICQTNHYVLNSDSVKAKFDEIGAVRMIADWTKSDPVITQELKKFGRNAVPLYVFYGKNKAPKILPQVLTPENVIEYLENGDK